MEEAVPVGGDSLSLCVAHHKKSKATELLRRNPPPPPLALRFFLFSSAVLGADSGPRRDNTALESHYLCSA